MSSNTQPEISSPTFPYIPRQALKVIELLENGGASDVLIVGGFVRDALLGVPSKDVDVEVYGLSYSQIRDILAPCFHVDLVGQAFGVLKVGRNIDVALPRAESKNGIGHRGFDVKTPSVISYREAFARRDFTINAIGLRRDGSFCDPYDGVGDLKRKILRATSPAFKDDPLRVLRGMQFAARLGFPMDSQTIQYCREVFSEFSTLSAERIYEEWKKWALKGVYPRLGLEILRESGWIKGFPELDALVGCPQNPMWHPEGDVWTHTLAVCEETARAIRDYKPELSDDERVVLMFAALTHDFGKPSTTRRDEQGVLRSRGHAEAGAPLASAFLERMKAPNRIQEAVPPLVAAHMATQNVDDPPSDRMVRRLANKLAPANIKLWALLCRSDAYGCFKTSENAASTMPECRNKIRFQADMWLEIAQRQNVAESAPVPILQGRDLIALGVKPGPKMGKILKDAFEAQLDGVFATCEEGVEYLKTSGLLNE